MNEDEPPASILRILRGLMPQRSLSYHEALQVAERQATRLLSLLDITEAPVPIEVITEQPHIRMSICAELPASGATHWDGNDWVIRVNGSEYHLRQRYTICHEYKHVLDHPVRHHRIRVAPGGIFTSDEAGERVADYFAACLLMPRTWVKTEFSTSRLSTSDLAHRFQVSAKAMSYRLYSLGLGPTFGDHRKGTDARWPPPRSGGHTYYRTLARARPHTPRGAFT